MAHHSHRKPVELSPTAPQAMVDTPSKVVLNSKFVGFVGGVYKAGRMHQLAPAQVIARVNEALQRHHRELVAWNPAAIDQALRYLEGRGTIKLPSPDKELALAGAGAR